MTLPYGFDDPDAAVRYGMVSAPGQVEAETDGYGCGLCLGDRHLAYADGTDGPCPNCQPEGTPDLRRRNLSMTVPGNDVRSAHVTQPIGTISDSPGNVRLDLGIDAHVQLDPNLTVMNRGAHAIRVSLAHLRPDHVPEGATPSEVRLLLEDAARLHQFLGDALDRARAINDTTRGE